MFASKTAILLFLFTLSSSVLATPPACLLAAVNQQPYPANLTAVCGGSNGHKVQQAIASLCGSNVAVAESAFAATCSSAGVTVGMLSLSQFNQDYAGKPELLTPILLASYTAASSMPTNSANGTFVYTTLSYDSSCSCTKTIVTSATGGAPGTASGVQATGSATATSSATGSAGATGAAAPGAQQAVGSLAAAVVAVAGLVAWL